jgi:hypothetical protein
VNCSRNGALRLVGYVEVSAGLFREQVRGRAHTVKVGFSRAVDVEDSTSAVEEEVSSKGAS